MPIKVSHDKANYREGDKSRNCASCVHMQPPTGCSIVASPIKADMVSDYYKAKK